MRHLRGQTILEYTVIVIILIGVMLAMRNYVKRGIQGRLKSATDEMGDQYDPQWVNSNVTYSTQGNSLSTVWTNQGVDASSGKQVSGQWTMRNDVSNTVENKTGFTQVGN